MGSTVGRGRGWEDLAPTLINLGSVTVSDWFLLASLPPLPRLPRLPKSFLPLPPPPPSLLVPQKLYTSGTSPLHPLILMIMPPIRIEARSVARSGRSNLLGDNAGRKTRGHLESLVNERNALNELSFPMNTCRTTQLASYILFQCQRWLTTLKSCELSDGWPSKQSNLISWEPLDAFGACDSPVVSITKCKQCDVAPSRSLWHGSQYIRRYRHRLRARVPACQGG